MSNLIPLAVAAESWTHKGCGGKVVAVPRAVWTVEAHDAKTNPVVAVPRCLECREILSITDVEVSIDLQLEGESIARAVTDAVGLESIDRILAAKEAERTK